MQGHGPLARKRMETVDEDLVADKTGYGLFANGMAELDSLVGALLKKVCSTAIA